VGENDKIVLLGMGFPGNKRDQDNMMGFLETEATARAFLSLQSGAHLSKMIADAGPEQMEEGAVNSSTGSYGAVDRGDYEQAPVACYAVLCPSPCCRPALPLTWRT
jgi:hypothetical protein